MRKLSVLLIACAAVLVGANGCSNRLPGVGAGPPFIGTTPDGLTLVKSTPAGDLYLREDHGIGGYDAVVVANSFVAYQRASVRLTDDNENLYLASLEQAIIDATAAARVRVVDEVGQCVITIGVGFIDVKLAPENSRRSVLGEMKIVMEMRDSESNESLMRFVAPKQINREVEGADRIAHIRQSLERMIREIDIIRVLQSARIAPSPPQPGCNGDLLEARPPDQA